MGLEQWSISADLNLASDSLILDHQAFPAHPCRYQRVRIRMCNTPTFFSFFFLMFLELQLRGFLVIEVRKRGKQ